MQDKKYYIPTNDYVFKRIFGRKGNEQITKDFLEAALNRECNDIVLDDSVELSASNISGKSGILDVKVSVGGTEQVDIEIQVAKSKCMIDRILWYWGKMYVDSIERGDIYNNAKKTICMLLADYEIEEFKAIEKFKSSWHIFEDNNREIQLTDKLEFIIIELRKLKDFATLTHEDNGLYNWCEFIKNPLVLEEENMSESIKMAKEKLEEINASDSERALAELREKAYRDELSMKKESFEEGRAEGLVEGKAEGIEEGKKLTNIENAKAMKEKGLDLELISEITGLDVKEIEKL